MVKIAEYQKQYRKNNKTRLQIYYKQWCEDNREYRKSQSKQYNLRHKERILKQRRQYREDNREKINQYWRDNKEYYAEYRQANKEHIAKQKYKYTKQYRQTPIGKAVMKADNHNRRALISDLTKETVQRVYEDNIKKFGILTCILCFKSVKFEDASLEHLTPLTRQGTNDYDNLGIAHLSCNCKKSTMTLEEWFDRNR